MRAVCPDERVVALIALGTPVAVEGRLYTYKFLENCAKPKLFISGSRDQFGPQENLKQVFALAAEPKQLVLVEGAEHFFEGKLSEVQTAIRNWVQQLLKPGKQAEAS